MNLELDEDGAQVFFQPNVAPAILGLYAFSGSILVVAPWLAGFYGTESSSYYILPFVLILGGLAQFSAAMWTFISRQWLTSVITTMWSSEHAAWSFLITLYLFEVVRKPGGAIPGFGIWYLALAWITWVGAVVSLKQNLIVMLTLTTGAFGATILGIDDMFGLNMFIFPGSILLIIAGILAWYAASALLLQSTFRKQILPVWPSKLKSGQGGGKTGRGEPGVKQSL